MCGSNEPVFQAIWADNTSFDEVIVSPTMINDHMPDNVMDALEKVKKNKYFSSNNEIEFLT